MKIAVLVKRVPDTAAALQVGPDGQSIDLSGVKFVMSPYDAHAVEAAMQLKEEKGGEVVIVSAGPPETKETIRAALAMGADSGILVSGEGLASSSCKGTGEILAATVQRLEPDLVFAGKQAVDDDAAQVPERVAEALGWAHASVVTRMDVGETTVEVDRAIEGGHYTLELPLPAVISVDKGLNTPRYPALPNIMKAKRKPIEELDMTTLGLDASETASAYSVVSLSLPRQDRLGMIFPGEMSESVTALMQALRQEEKVL